MAVFLRKYGVLTVSGTTAIRIPIIKRGVVDFAVSADWTPAAGDVKVAIDGAAPTNVVNLPTAVAAGNGAYWEFVPTAAELTCKQAIYTIVDAATKAIEDQCFLVETYGNASAMYAADFSAANLPVDVQTIKTQAVTCAAGVTVGAFVGNATAALAVDASGRIDIGKALGTAVTLDANNAMNVSAKYLAGTALTGRDIGASVLLSAGSAAGQLDFTSGVVKSNPVQWLGGTIPAVNVTGVPLVDLKYTLGTISPATAGSVRADSVTGAVGSVTGAVGSVTGAVGSVTGSVGSVAGNVVGSVGSVAGNVTGNVAGSTGSVTGNVGGNVVGSVASVATGGITAASFAAAAITSAVAPNLDAAVSTRASPTNITSATGVVLAATGLDQISVADPGAAANLTTFPKIMVWLFRRFFAKTTMTATQVKTYADDGTTVNVTQTVSDDNTTQTQGKGA